MTSDFIWRGFGGETCSVQSIVVKPENIKHVPVGDSIMADEAVEEHLPVRCYRSRPPSGIIHDPDFRTPFLEVLQATAEFYPEAIL